eukprot:Opistho-2@31480
MSQASLLNECYSYLETGHLKEKRHELCDRGAIGALLGALRSNGSHERAIDTLKCLAKLLFKSPPDHRSLPQRRPTKSFLPISSTRKVPPYLHLTLGMPLRDCTCCGFSLPPRTTHRLNASRASYSLFSPALDALNTAQLAVAAAGFLANLTMGLESSLASDDKLNSIIPESAASLSRLSSLSDGGSLKVARSICNVLIHLSACKERRKDFKAHGGDVAKALLTLASKAPTRGFTNDAVCELAVSLTRLVQRLMPSEISWRDTPQHRLPADAPNVDCAIRGSLASSSVDNAVAATEWQWMFSAAWTFLVTIAPNNGPLCQCAPLKRAVITIALVVDVRLQIDKTVSMSLRWQIWVATVSEPPLDADDAEMRIALCRSGISPEVANRFCFRDLGDCTTPQDLAVSLISSRLHDLRQRAVSEDDFSNEAVLVGLRTLLSPERYSVLSKVTIAAATMRDDHFDLANFAFRLARSPEAYLVPSEHLEVLEELDANGGRLMTSDGITIVLVRSPAMADDNVDEEGSPGDEAIHIESNIVGAVPPVEDGEEILFHAGSLARLSCFLKRWAAFRSRMVAAGEEFANGYGPRGSLC